MTEGSWPHAYVGKPENRLNTIDLGIIMRLVWGCTCSCVGQRRTHIGFAEVGVRNRGLPRAQPIVLVLLTYMWAGFNLACRFTVPPVSNIASQQGYNPSIRG